MEKGGHRRSWVSRRSVVVGFGVALTGAIAGCLGDDSPVASCSSRAGTADNITRVMPLQGTDQISLGIVVPENIPSDGDFTDLVVRNRDGGMVADIPLRDNRYMSETDPAFPSSIPDGELYAVPLGPPPQHGEYSVELVDADGTVVSNATTRFNCYAWDGELP